MSSTSARQVIPKLVFARFGVPERIKMDNVPPFNGNEFRQWCRKMGIEYRRITPLWPRANAEAERFMQSMGKLIHTSYVTTGHWRPHLASFLRHYRPSPHTTTGVSPAELLLGRKIRTELPSFPASASQSSKVQQAAQRSEEKKEKARQRANEALPVDPEIDQGDKVLVKQRPRNKTETPYDPRPLQVVSRRGTMVTAENGVKSITRDVSFFRKLRDTVEVSQEPAVEDNHPWEGTEPVSAEDSSTPTVELEEAVPCQAQAEQGEVPLRRSLRQRRAQ